MSTLVQQRQQPVRAPGLSEQAQAQPANPLVSVRREPAAPVPDCPVERPRAFWRAILTLSVETLREWRRRTVARRERSNFDERTVRDIGVDPSMVNYEIRQSFWRPLRDLRR